jgi:hypothetical protein
MMMRMCRFWRFSRFRGNVGTDSRSAKVFFRRTIVCTDMRGLFLNPMMSSRMFGTRHMTTLSTHKTMITIPKRELQRNASTTLVRRRDVHTANGIKPTPFVKFMQYMSQTAIFSEKRKMELYPPFFLMRVNVSEISSGWRKIRVKLPLNFTSRNPGT